MGDLPVPTNTRDFESLPEIRSKWIAAKLQECRSRIVRHQQDIEDCKKQVIVELERKIMILEKEIEALEEQGREIQQQ